MCTRAQIVSSLKIKKILPRTSRCTKGILLVVFLYFHFFSHRPKSIFSFLFLFFIYISFHYIVLYCSNVFLFLFLYSTKTQFTSFYFLNFLDNIRLTSSCSVLVKWVGNCILKLIIKSPLPPSVLGNPSFDTSTLEVGFNT